MAFWEVQRPLKKALRPGCATSAVTGGADPGELEETLLVNLDQETHDASRPVGIY
jgi:hypothetical protein